jgi:hypothetical protein
MVVKAHASGIILRQCSTPRVDSGRALYVDCITSSEDETVRFATFADNPGAEAPVFEELSKKWKAHAGDGWIVAAYSRKATLDELVAALLR